MDAAAAINIPDERKESWIERLVGTFLYPRETFKRIAAENVTQFTGFGGAAAIAALAFLLEGIRLSGLQSASAASWSAAGSLMLFFSQWFVTVAMLAILSSCFGGHSGNLRAIIITVGWSFAPMLLVSPLCNFAALTGSFAMVLTWIPYLWVFALQVLAVMCSFNMKVWQALLLAFVVPGLYTALQVLQFIQALWSSLSQLAK
jgi:hypothetical protein